MYLERVLATVLQDGTAQAHGLGCAVAVAARWASLTVGMEEDVRILAPAGAIELPFPQICNWPWQAAHGLQERLRSMVIKVLFRWCLADVADEGLAAIQSLHLVAECLEDDVAFHF
jgi:hypothetical protein